MSSKGDAVEKGETNMAISAQLWLCYLQVIKQLMRDMYPLLQPVCPNQIAPARIGLVDVSKKGFGSGLSMPNGVSYGREDLHGRVHARNEVWCE